MTAKLTDLRIGEVSLVDRGANQHSHVALFKRDDGSVQKDMYGVSRFAEMLGSLGYLLQSCENEAEYEADGSRVPAALRTWLKAGLPIFRAMSTEEVDEFITGMMAKREFSAKERQSAAASGAAESDGSFPIKSEADLKNAMRAIGRSKNPAKTKAHIRARAKALGLTSMLSDAFKREDTMIGKALSFFKSFGRATDSLSESVKSIVDDPSVADRGALIDETIKQFSEHVEETLEKTLSGGEPGELSQDETMSAALKKALGLADTATEADLLSAVAKKDEELKKRGADLAQRNTELDIAKAAMSDDESKYHDSLNSDDEKKKFRGMTRAERAKEMKKVEAPLPDHIVKALADVEALKKSNADLQRDRDIAIFSKRASDIGLGEAHGELLMKAHAGDKAAVAKLEDAIKGLNEQIATGKLFSEFGTSAGGAVDAVAEVTAKAEEIRKADPKLTIEKARAKVVEDPANRELVKRYNSERAAKTQVRAA